MAARERASLWFRRGGATIVAGLAAAVAYAAQIFANNSSLSLQWTLAVVGSTLAVIALVIPLRDRAKAEGAARRVDAYYRVALNDVLLPFTDILENIVTESNDAKRRAEAQGVAKSYIVYSVRELVAASRSRACYYEYEHNGNVETLTCKGIHAGRAQHLQTVFSSGNSDHLGVFQLLRNREAEFRADLTINAPAYFPANRDYQTYISAPVATSKEIMGLITLDAPAPGDLVPEDEQIVRLFAQLLAIALKGTGSRSIA
jgi:GAF domain-containing protein